MTYLFPRSAAEAVALLASRPAARLIAGGTDLAVQMADGGPAPRTLIDLSRVEALSGVRRAAAGVHIGPATTIARLASGGMPADDAGLPACLVQGARSIGAPQVRNLATIGGNVCNASPCGDTLAPLVALGAVFTLLSPRGSREVAAEAFFTGPKRTVLRPDELLADILVPAGALAGRSAFRMIGRRNGQAISQVNLAVWLLLEDGRVREARAAAGSVAPVPLRLPRTEEALRGGPLSAERLAAAEERLVGEIRPISDVRASEAYRFAAARGLFRELCAELGGAA